MPSDPGWQSHLLSISTGQIWDTASLLQKFGITRQSLENIRLSQRELYFLVLIVEVDHEVLDLPRLSIPFHLCTVRRLTIPRRPREAHRAPCPLRFSKSQAVAASRVRLQFIQTSLSSHAYLDSPFAHMIGLLLRFRPIERRSNGSAIYPSTSCSQARQSFMWDGGTSVQQTHNGDSTLEPGNSDMSCFFRGSLRNVLCFIPSTALFLSFGHSCIIARGSVRSW